MPISSLENSLKQLEKINRKWKVLKKEVDIKDCIINKDLSLKKWLNYSNYVKRIQLVPKIINIEKIIYENNLIKLTYKYYNPHKNKLEIFTRQIPLNLRLNNEFMYFFGLWCGDRFRVGISNSCIELLKFTSNFLKNNLKQKESSILGEVLSSYKLTKSEWRYHNKILRNIGATKIRDRISKKALKRKCIGYSILLSNNYVLWHILKSLEYNLNNLFSIIDEEQRFAFYAGFFDAEGHANKYHKRLEFHQYRNKNSIIFNNVYKYLKLDGFNPKNHNNKAIFIAHNTKIRNKDFNLFEEKVLKFMKHPDRVQDIKDMLNNNYVKRQYVILAYWIYKNPNKISTEINKAFNQNLDHIRLKLRSMMEEGIILRARNKRSFTYSLTKKGKEWVQDNRELMLYILNQVKNFNSWGGGMYVKSSPALKELLQYSLNPFIR